MNHVMKYKNYSKHSLEWSSTHRTETSAKMQFFNRNDGLFLGKDAKMQFFQRRI